MNKTTLFSILFLTLYLKVRILKVNSNLDSWCITARDKPFKKGIYRINWSGANHLSVSPEYSST